MREGNQSLWSATGLTTRRGADWLTGEALRNPLEASQLLTYVQQSERLCVSRICVRIANAEAYS